MITNMSALTLTDAEQTPVNHSYVPASRTAENTARWRDQEHNSGLAIGYATVAYSLKEPSAVGGIYRQKVMLTIPKLDLTAPASPKLLGVTRVNCEFLFPDILLDQDRKNAVQMFRGLLAQGMTTSLGDNIVTQILPY